MGAPAGPAEAFMLLVSAGRITPALGQRLAGAAGLRNLIVHRYAEIDADKILQVIGQNLDDLEAFVRAMNA